MYDDGKEWLANDNKIVMGKNYNYLSVVDFNSILLLWTLTYLKPQQPLKFKPGWKF